MVIGKVKALQFGESITIKEREETKVTNAQHGLEDDPTQLPGQTEVTLSTSRLRG